MDSEGLSRSVATLYESAAGADGWGTFLQTLATSLGVPAAGLTRHSLKPGDLLEVSSMHGLSDEACRLYADHYGALDPWIGELRATGGFSPGRTLVVTSEQFACATSLHRGAYFNDFGKRHGSAGQAGISIADGAGRSIVGLTLPRPVTRAPYGAGIVRGLQLIAPHLSLALRVFDLHARPQGARGVSEALESATSWLFAMSSKGALVWANQAGRDALNRGDVIHGDGDGLRATTNRAHSALARTIRMATVALNGTPAAYGPCFLPSTGVPKAAIAWAVPLAGLAGRGDRFGRSSILLVVEPRVPPEAATALQHAFALTATESRVAMALRRGECPREIAQALRLTQDALRWHVKELMRKIGVRHRAALVGALGAAERALASTHDGD